LETLLNNEKTKDELAEDLEEILKEHTKSFIDWFAVRLVTRLNWRIFDQMY